VHKIRKKAESGDCRKTGKDAIGVSLCVLQSEVVLAKHSLEGTIAQKGKDRKNRLSENKF